jgi:hypothetical protein
MRLCEAAAGALIVDGAIIAAKLATGAVTANAIAANSVTTNAIAANAVTANEIAANAVTTAKIAAGAVSADQIAANAITVKHLTVMDYSNIVLDPFMQDTSSWATFTELHAVVATTAGVPAGMPACQDVVFNAAYGAQPALHVTSRSVEARSTTCRLMWLLRQVAMSIRLMLQCDATMAQKAVLTVHTSSTAAATLANPDAVNTWQKIEGRHRSTLRRLEHLDACG